MTNGRSGAENALVAALAIGRAWQGAEATERKLQLARIEARQAALYRQLEDLQREIVRLSLAAEVSG